MKSRRSVRGSLTDSHDDESRKGERSRTGVSRGRVLVSGGDDGDSTARDKSFRGRSKLATDMTTASGLMTALGFEINLATEGFAPAISHESQAMSMAARLVYLPGPVPERRQNPALDEKDARLDLRLVPGRTGPTRRDEEAVALGRCSVAPLRLGIVEDGARDAGLQIVDDHPKWDAAEPLERANVEGDERLDALVEDDLALLVATERERHDEEPGAPLRLSQRIEDKADVAEVDLRFLAGGDLDPKERLRVAALELLDEAEERRVASGEAPLAEESEDGLDLDTGLALLRDERPVDLDERRRTRRRPVRRPGLGEASLDDAGTGELLGRDEALLARPLAVLRDGVATDCGVRVLPACHGFAP